VKSKQALAVLVLKVQKLIIENPNFLISFFFCFFSLVCNKKDQTKNKMSNKISQMPTRLVSCDGEGLMDLGAEEGEGFGGV
jgi:hypothetical protein